jgi:hypothetical protein
MNQVWALRIEKVFSSAQSGRATWTKRGTVTKSFSNFAKPVSTCSRRRAAETLGGAQALEPPIWFWDARLMGSATNKQHVFIINPIRPPMVSVVLATRPLIARTSPALLH